MDLFKRLSDTKLLLVDDDQLIRDSLGELFQLEGCHFRAVESATEALSLLNGQSYDIIVSEYNLPDMDGLEFFRLAGNSHPHAMKILFIMYRSVDVKSEAIKMGVDDIIEKPFKTVVVEESIKRLIEKREDNRLRAKA